MEPANVAVKTQLRGVYPFAPWNCDSLVPNALLPQQVLTVTDSGVLVCQNWTAGASPRWIILHP